VVASPAWFRGEAGAGRGARRLLPARSWFVNLLMAPGERPDSAWGRMAHIRRAALDPGRPETFVTRDASGTFHAHVALRWDRGMDLPARQDSLRGLGDSRAGAH